MSAVDDKTWDLFMAASRSDDDFGYPNEVEFVPGDQEWADDAVWRNLVEGHPTVLVDENAELLLFPLRRSLVDWLCAHVPVNVAYYTDGRISPYAIASRLGRHPVRQMRELAREGDGRSRIDAQPRTSARL